VIARRHAASGRLGFVRGVGPPCVGSPAGWRGRIFFLRLRGPGRAGPRRGPRTKSQAKPALWNFLMRVNKSAGRLGAPFLGSAWRRIEIHPAQSRGRPIRLALIQRNVRLLGASPPRSFGGSPPQWHSLNAPCTRAAPAHSRRAPPRMPLRAWPRLASATRNPSRPAASGRARRREGRF